MSNSNNNSNNSSAPWAKKVSEILRSLAVKQAIQVELGNKRKSLGGEEQEEGIAETMATFHDGLMSILISDIMTSAVVEEAIESEHSKLG
jgi:hypothetical protein